MDGALTDPDRAHAMRWGIEAEFGLVDDAGRLVDFTHARSGELQGLVDGLPDHGDADLTRGDLAIKWSRWYVEGDERFGEDGTFLRCVPKGIEIRTPVYDGLAESVESLAALAGTLASTAADRGLRLTALGHNPFHSTYTPEPSFNPWELAMRAEHHEYDAPEVYMCSYGPDVNVSVPEWDTAASVAAASRLAAWAPEIVAFSLNAPFVDGAPYGGLSYRTAVRAGRRPAVRLFLPPPPGDQGIRGDQGIQAGLSLRPARISPEVGRIEFKALDAFADLRRFRAFCSLIGGLARAVRAPNPAALFDGLDADPAARLRRAARLGFEDAALVARCAVLLDLVAEAWGGDPTGTLLDPLFADLCRRRHPAHDLLERHAREGSVPLPELVLP